MNYEGHQVRERGFASMDTGRQREIASMGGRAAHRQGTAHQFTSEEARAAGRKGGEAVSANRAHMAEIGRRGGEASRRRATTTRQQPAANASAATTSIASESPVMRQQAAAIPDDARTDPES